jgi:hypothetical protein
VFWLDSLMIFTSPVVAFGEAPVVAVVAPVVVAGAIVGFVITGRAGAGLAVRRVRFFFLVCASPWSRPTVRIRQIVIRIFV